MQPIQSTRAIADGDGFRLRQDGQLVHIAASDVKAYMAPTPASTSNVTLQSQILTANKRLLSTDPYRTIVNSASAITIQMPIPGVADDTRVVSNVGAGTVTVNFAGRTGNTNKTLAQDNAATFAYNATLGYWTIE